MSIPLFLPPARIVEHLDDRRAIPLRELLAAAGVPCRATGRFTDRLVCVVPGKPGLIEREPGDWAAVRIGVPSGLSARNAARYASAVMAYGLMDLVARESLRGQLWARPTPPRGRPARGLALTGVERQRNYRARRLRRKRRKGNRG
ncbi:MAG: hypothetical protein ACHQ17_10785 [Polyangia bacterium]|jgi:hypothetical protein